MAKTKAGSAVGVSLSPAAIAVVEKLMEINGPSRSAAIERIIREWAALTKGKK